MPLLLKCLGERIQSLSKIPLTFNWVLLMYSSIVAVHGLNGDAFRTWTTNKTNKFWLGDPDLLPANLKHARILTFSYNASVTALFGKTSSDRILQHAQTLIAELVADREARTLFR